MNNPPMTEELEKHYDTLKKAAIKNINDYIDNMLEECNNFCPIKQFSVIQHYDFAKLKEGVDRICAENPDMELGGAIGQIECLGNPYYVAVLVEYDEAKRLAEEAAKRAIEETNGNN